MLLLCSRLCCCRKWCCFCLLLRCGCCMLPARCFQTRMPCKMILLSVNMRPPSFHVCLRTPRNLTFRFMRASAKAAGSSCEIAGRPAIALGFIVKPKACNLHERDPAGGSHQRFSMATTQLQLMYLVEIVSKRLKFSSANGKTSALCTLSASYFSDRLGPDRA